MIVNKAFIRHDLIVLSREHNHAGGHFDADYPSSGATEVLGQVLTKSYLLIQSRNIYLTALLL